MRNSFINLNLTQDESNIVNMIPDIVVFGQFALAKFKKLEYHSRRINGFVSMNENILRGNMEMIQDRFNVVEIENEKILQFIITFKDDTNLNKPYLSLYCVSEGDKSLITETPFTFLQCYLVGNIFYYTEDFEACIKKDLCKIYCNEDDEIEYLTTYAQTFREQFGIDIFIERIEGEIYDSEMIQTF